MNTQSNTNMKTSVLTFRQALVILEEQFDSIYRGISTVKEMTTDLVSAISFEGEDPETIYHRFETKVGPNRIVKDDQVMALALHYVWLYYCYSPPNCPINMNTHPKIQNILDTLPTFITEMDADWEMVTDYVMSQIQPTYMEWVEIGKVFDNTLDW